MLMVFPPKHRHTAAVDQHLVLSQPQSTPHRADKKRPVSPPIFQATVRNLSHGDAGFYGSVRCNWDINPQQIPLPLGYGVIVDVLVAFQWAIRR